MALFSAISSDLQAWMRARGDSATEILTAESMAVKYGVQQGSYEAVPLPADADVQQVRVATVPAARHTAMVKPRFQRDTRIQVCGPVRR